jgi:hypothetical protein
VGGQLNPLSIKRNGFWEVARRDASFGAILDLFYKLSALLVIGGLLNVSAENPSESKSMKAGASHQPLPGH